MCAIDLAKEQIKLRALGRAYHYLKYRPRTVKEMRDFLSQKLFEQDIIELVVSELIELKFLDDQVFAKWYLTGRYLSRKKSPSLLVREMARMGVEQQVIEQVLQNSNVNKSDEDRAYGALAVVWSRLSRLPSARDRQNKATQYLLRRGYAYDTIKNAIAKCLESDYNKPHI